MSERQSQCDRVLARLKQGPATSWQLQQLGICSHTSRISELRKLGHKIEATDTWRGRQRVVTYRLLGQSELFPVDYLMNTRIKNERNIGTRP